jgi:hypothetical protein
MANTSTSRIAAAIAATIAVPAALTVGVVSYRNLEPSADAAASTRPAAPPATPPGSSAATDPVAVPAPPVALPAAQAQACRALIGRLPNTVGGLVRRSVTQEHSAAFGDPPIILTCGGASPSAPRDAQFYEINGVCWYPQEQPDAAVWWLRGRQVTVRVAVPRAHDGQDLVDFAAPIEATDPRIGPICG